MSAREEITHLMNRYCFALDAGDLDGFASLFEHGEWTMEGFTPKFGKQDLLHVTSNVILYEDGTPKTKHITSNVDLKIDDEAGTAKSQCYVTVLQQTDNFPLQAIFSGHYFDDFERVGGRWRFAKRIIRNMLVGNLSVHLKSAASAAAGA